MSLVELAADWNRTGPWPLDQAARVDLFDQVPPRDHELFRTMLRDGLRFYFDWLLEDPVARLPRDYASELPLEIYYVED